MGYGNKIFACPFYMDDDRLEVSCENGQKVRFRDFPSRSRFVDAHCANVRGWAACSIARMLSDEWDEMERKGKGKT